MNRFVSALVPALLLSACEPSQPDSAAPKSDETSPAVPAPLRPAGSVETSIPDPHVLGPEGVGDIVIGEAPPSTLKADAVQISDTCRTYSDPQRRLYAMTDGEVVMRITAMRDSLLETERGIAVGASEAAVRKAYPEAVEQPHQYVEAPGKYLDWRPGGGSSGLRFEIDGDGKVNLMHAGREPHLEYPEGCA